MFFKARLAPLEPVMPTEFVEAIPAKVKLFTPVVPFESISALVPRFTPFVVVMERALVPAPSVYHV